MMKIGFHLSISGGVSSSAAEAAGSGYSAFQIFVSSSRSWKHSVLGRDDVVKFRRSVAASGALPNAHIPYLCNPSSTNRLVLDRSLGMLVNNMNSCSELGIRYLVVHMGSHLGAGREAGEDNLVKTIGSALDMEKRTSLLLENSAGYKNSVGSKFAEIGSIVDRIASSRVGVCLDTCHAFAAGYDLHTDTGTQKCYDEFDSSIGIGKLKLVHLNDARHPLGSGLDRHWHIGKGFIGMQGFINFFRNRHFGAGPFIMETPVDAQGSRMTDMHAALLAMKKAHS